MNKLAVAAVCVAAILLGTAAALGAGLFQTGSSSTCASCSRAPVVDIVMPSLGTSGNFTNPNRAVNMTQGESKVFEVDIYPTVELGFEMSFRSVLVSASGGQAALSEPITATFLPSALSVGANEKGSTLVTVTVPGGAAKGTYDAVVSATDQSDSSEVWGLYFEIVVA